LTKLNEANQQWLKDNRNPACGGAYYTKDVEAKLLEMQEQHNKSAAEWRDAFEGMHQRAMKVERELAKYEEIRTESQGVAGFHQNGDIALWEEFDD